MPLTAAQPRAPIHDRQVRVRGYHREDGLWDIEGHLVDTKTYEIDNRHRGAIPPGEPIHEMWLRVTIDDGMLIHRVEASTDFAPFGSCPVVTPRFAELEGLTIGPGFKRRVVERVGGRLGCTHLVETCLDLLRRDLRQRADRTNLVGARWLVFFAVWWTPITVLWIVYG